MSKFMKTNSYASPLRAITLLLLFLACAAGPWRALAQSNPNPPERLSYQGFLVDANGVALGNTAPKNYDVIFRVFPAQTGGAVLWAEQQTVTVDKGYFSVLLGEGSTVLGESRPAISTLFSAADASDRFVETTVKGLGSGGANVTILPRLRFLSSPYSFLSRNAVSAANLVNHTNGQVVNISGAFVGINKTLPGSALDVNGTVTATAFTGSGANLTGLNAANIATGTLDEARLSTNVALLNRNPQIFGGNIGINNTTGPGANNLQIGNQFHGANGYALQVNNLRYGANIQIARNQGEDGHALIIDNNGWGNSASTLLWLRNNLYNQASGGAQTAMQVTSDGRIAVNSVVQPSVTASIACHPGSYLLYLWRSDRANLAFAFQEDGVAWKLGGGGWSALSDRRIKHNIQDLSGALDKLLQLRSVTFEFNDQRQGEGTQTGFIAQEVETVFPNWVSESPDKLKGITFRGFEALTVQALREIRTEKDNQIRRLEEENQALRAELASQEKNLKNELQELRQMVEGLVTRTASAK